MLSIDPIRPYLGLIKAGGIVVLMAFAFVKGCNHGEANKAAEVKRISGQRDDAQRQATALAGKITEANKQVEANKKAAEQAQDRAEDAGKVASGNERALKKRIAEIKHELDQARNKSPECDELLTTSVKKVCGL